MVSSYDKFDNMKDETVYWFEADSDEQLASRVFDTVKQIQHRQYYKTEQNLRYYRLYSNQGNKGTFVNEFSLKTKMQMLSLNVVQSITDTITSNIGKNKPKVTFLTDHGNYQMKERAKKLDMFTQGQFNTTGVYQKAPLTLKRACVFGDGYVKPYIQDGEIKLEKVYPEEIKVDEMELDDPRSLYRVKLVSRKLVMQMYPDKADKIKSIMPGSYKDLYMIGAESQIVDLIPVIEAYRLPSRKGATDGRHCLITLGCVLSDKPYKKDYFEIVKLPFSEGILGYYGVGVAELLVGIQYEINKTLKRIQQSIHLMAVPRVFYEYGSDIVEEHFDNEIGSMVGYSRTPPTIITPQTVGAEVFNHLDRLYQRAFEIIGVSQMSAGGQKMQGLDSGEAIRTFRDVETARFATLQENYDNFHLEIARQYIDLAKEIAEKDSSYSVLSKSSEGTIKIKWKDVAMKDDEYILQMYPTSLLPTEPAGRLSTVIEMTQAGMFSQKEAMELLDYPDVKSITSIKNAKLNDILKTIFHMIEEGEYLPPEPFQDLELGIEYCQAYYLKFRLQDVSPEKLNLLTQWISDARAILIPPQMEDSINQTANQVPTQGNPDVQQGMDGIEQTPMQAMEPEQEIVE